MSRRLIETSDELYDATTDLSAIHDRIVEFDRNEARDLDALDLFSGQGAYANTCADSGMTCRAADIAHDPIRENILCKQGFFFIVQLVCSIDSCFKKQDTFWVPCECYGHLGLVWGCLGLFLGFQLV